MMGLYMIRPASQDVDKVKDKIQKSDYLWYKDLKKKMMDYHDGKPNQ